MYKIEIDFSDKKRVELGFYPTSQAEKLAEKRKLEHSTFRSNFLKEKGIEDKKQKILVYFGGNNDAYFKNAFPAFLSFIAQATQDKDADLSNVIIVIQQHPGAKKENQDGHQVDAWLKEHGEKAKMPKVFLSNVSSDDAQILADAAFYYQTSMGPQFALAGIPPFQIGHETYEDILVRNHLASTVTSAEGFLQAMENLEKTQEMDKNLILEKLGIREDWPERLESAIKEFALV